MTYCNLYNIGCNQVQLLESAENGSQLPRRPTSSLRRTRSRRKRRVKSVDVNGQVDGFFSADTLDDLLDDTSSTNGVNLTGLYNLETAVPVVVVVARSTQGGPDTSMDVGVVQQQALHGSMVEVGAVVDAGDLRGRSAENLRPPCKTVSQLTRISEIFKMKIYKYQGGYRSESR